MRGEDVAQRQPIAYLKTSANILAGNSSIQEYGPPYTADSGNVQQLLGIAPATRLGVTVPINPPEDLILKPLARVALLNDAVAELTIGLMIALANNMRMVFWIAVIPALLSAAIAIVWVREPDARPRAAPGAPIQLRGIGGLGAGFWKVVIVGFVFTLARFSEAFLVLIAGRRGLPLALAPLVLVTMNAVYALGAYPAGILADRLPARTLLRWGLVSLMLADALLALAAQLPLVFVGIALWGANMALTQGLLSKLVADCSPVALRGTAFGLFNLVTGIAMLAASVLAGVLWDIAGPVATFATGGALALLALALALPLLGSAPARVQTAEPTP